jgi:predicted O-methyltransferase YrrM
VTREREETWAVVEGYLTGLLLAPDPAAEAALRVSTAAGLPSIQVSPTQGKLLFLLARAVGARRILEIGTLGGYSAIWLARALPPGGRLVTLEVEPRHAQVAQGNLERAGLAAMVEVRLGRALDTLPSLLSEAPFDLVFIDADKPSNTEYLEWAVRLSRPGTLVVIDNVVRGGDVLDAQSEDARVQGTRRVLERIAAEPRLTATAIQTVSEKGHDGFALALVDV